MSVNPSTGIKNFDEFVRAAKAQPKKLNYASGGQGHPTHLIMELMANRLGFELQHVPYKGAAPAIQAVASGEVNGMIVGLAEALPMIKAGRITAIAASGPMPRRCSPSCRCSGTRTRTWTPPSGSASSGRPTCRRRASSIRPPAR
jgi:tripartite-type tricarboxylate transporter receptor subunit TctC